MIGNDMSAEMIELTLMLMREEWYKQQKMQEQNKELMAMLRANQ
jgi:hypothetical protein